jgi:hypothetical protein
MTLVKLEEILAMAGGAIMIDVQLAWSEENETTSQLN